MVYRSSRVAERVPAEATKASRVGRRRTREAVLLVSVPRPVVDGDLFAGFDEAFEVKVGLSTFAGGCESVEQANMNCHSRVCSWERQKYVLSVMVWLFQSK